MGWRKRPGRRPGLGLTEEEVYGQLEKPPIRGAPFLWRYSRDQLPALLERAGILPRIRQLGYEALQISSLVEEGLHVLRVEAVGERAPLVDLRLSEESRVPTGPFVESLGPEPLALLVIQWVSLQHVRGRFAPGRPPLPGQSFPGLGLGRRLYRWLWRLARELGKDALSAYPMYYHNALYYSAGFSYLDPRQQGELAALARDLAEIPLHVASEAIRRGLLREGRGNRPVDWSPGEMFAAVSRRLSAFMGSAEYRTEVERVATGLSFGVEIS